MRKHSLGLAIAGLLAPSLSFALGLGEISTNSALNQPLDAEIELVSTSPGEVGNVSVKLAPNAVFDQVGIERTAVLEQLNFTPTVINGVPVIKVTSPGSIQEPFVNFVVEVTWPKGKLLREYTVLLDPPVLSDNAGAPPVAAATPIFTGPDTQVAEVESYPVEEGLPVEQVEPIVQAVEEVQTVEDTVFAETYPVEDTGPSIVEVDPGLETYSVADAGAGEGLPPFIDDVQSFDGDIQAYEGDVLVYDDSESTFVEDTTTVFSQTYGSLDEAPGTSEIFVFEPGDAPLFDETVAYSESIQPVYAGGDYTVAKGDNLSGIAAELRNSEVSLARMMAGLFQANKSAFIDSNVNKLKSGYVLRIPDEAGLADLSQADASALLAANGYNEYRKALAKTATPQEAMDAAKDSGTIAGLSDLADAKKTPAVEVSSTTEAATSGLEILGAKDALGDSATGTADGKADSGAVDALKEQLASKSQESTELQSRVEELEGLLTAKERLISLKDEQLADMQQSLSNETEMEVGKAEKGESSSGKAGLLPTEEPEIKSEEPAKVETAKAAETEITPVEPITETAETAPVEVAEATTLVDDLKQNPRKLLLGGGAGLLLFAMLAWLASRRKDGRDETIIDVTESDDLSTVVADEPDIPDLTEHDVVDVATEYDNELATGQFDSIDLDEELEDTSSHSIQLSADELDIQQQEIRQDLSSVDAAGGAEDEVLSEANVYLAYGLHDQAIDLLKPAVSANPDRNDYQAKLLEAYHATNNQDAFADEAEKLHTKLAGDDKGLWQRIIVMGQDIVPDHELFKNADPGEMTLGSLHKDRPDLASVDLEDLPELDDGQATVSIDDSDIQNVLEESSASEEFRLPELDELNYSSDTGAEDALSLAEADKSQEINLDDLGDLQSESSLLSGMKDKLGGLSDKTKAAGAAVVGGVAAAGVAAKDKVSDLGKDDEGDFTLADMESEFTDMSSGVDHIGTKLDLAKAYLDMGDEEGAREALNEVIAQGSTEQQNEAKTLLDTIS